MSGVSQKRLAIHEVVTRVLQAVEPERCLRNISLKPQLMPSHSGVHADEDLLIGALVSVLLATFALVDGADVPVSVSARCKSSGGVQFPGDTGWHQVHPVLDCAARQRMLRASRAARALRC